MGGQQKKENNALDSGKINYFNDDRLRLRGPCVPWQKPRKVGPRMGHRLSVRGRKMWEKIWNKWNNKGFTA